MNQSPVLEVTTPTTPSAVSKAQIKSNFLGSYRCRAVYVAYAFARGVPYAVVEDPAYTRIPSKNWRESFVYTVATEVHRLQGLPQAFDIRPSEMPAYKARHQETREAIQTWMAVPLSQERVARRDAARTAWFERKAANATRIAKTRQPEAVSA